MEQQLSGIRAARARGGLRATLASIMAKNDQEAVRGESDAPRARIGRHADHRNYGARGMSLQHRLRSCRDSGRRWRAPAGSRVPPASARGPAEVDVDHPSLRLWPDGRS